MSNNHDFQPELSLAPWCDCGKDGKCQGKCLGSGIERVVKDYYGTQGLAFLKAHVKEENIMGGNAEDEKGLHREESSKSS